MIRDEILKAYSKTKSMRKTAEIVNCSHTAVRKVLVGAGIISTPLTQRIAGLQAAGMSQKHIAELLGVSSSCVNANTPYQRGTYLDENKSVNALCIKAHRTKKEKTYDD